MCSMSGMQKFTDEQVLMITSQKCKFSANIIVIVLKMEISTRMTIKFCDKNIFIAYSSIVYFCY